MIIPNLRPFPGQHCETTTTGTLLLHLGIELSEPMLFGLGEGLGFIFWNMKMMDFPFIGGRVKPDALTSTISRNLKLALEVNETSSAKKAWERVKEKIDEGTPVGIKLDCFHLEYFSSPVHFAGHYAAIYGYDDDDACLVDTIQQGGRVKTSLKSLALARNEKGLMASKNLFYTISLTDEKYRLEDAVRMAIRNNAKEYLNPPINNIGFKGIAKTSVEIKKWFQKSKNRKRDFCTTAMLMEKAGTGGSIFRNLYRDFLKESYDLLKNDVLKEAFFSFSTIAEQWALTASLFDKAGNTEDKKYIDQASEILMELSEKEKMVMELLMEI